MLNVQTEYMFRLRRTVFLIQADMFYVQCDFTFYLRTDFMFNFRMTSCFTLRLTQCLTSRLLYILNSDWPHVLPTDSRHVLPSDWLHVGLLPTDCTARILYLQTDSTLFMNTCVENILAFLKKTRIYVFHRLQNINLSVFRFCCVCEPDVCLWLDHIIIP